MSDRKSWFNSKGRAAAAWIAAVVSVTLFFTAGCGSKQQEPQGQESGGTQVSDEPQGQESGNGGAEGTSSASAGTLSLVQFCDDEELNAWFDSLEENTPVKMTYIIMGEAPIAMEFTDRDLILQTAEASISTWVRKRRRPMWRSAGARTRTGMRRHFWRESSRSM